MSACVIGNGSMNSELSLWSRTSDAANIFWSNWKSEYRLECFGLRVRIVILWSPSFTHLPTIGRLRIPSAVLISYWEQFGQREKAIFYEVQLTPAGTTSGPTGK